MALLLTAIGAFIGFTFGSIGYVLIPLYAKLFPLAVSMTTLGLAITISGTVLAATI